MHARWPGARGADLAGRAQARTAALYNSGMRFAPLFLLLTLAGASAAAQQPGTRPPPAPTQAPATRQDPAPGRDRGHQRVERIHHQDAGSTIEELRYGGQTQSITVQPSADVPAYEILPEGGAYSRSPSRDGVPGPAGQRVWNVLKF